MFQNADAFLSEKFINGTNFPLDTTSTTTQCHNHLYMVIITTDNHFWTNSFCVFQALFAITQLFSHVSVLLTSACKQA